jgi:glycerophosphoryl diester phosphodiesterase
MHRSPIIYAHRGANLERPENTLEAFALALELGADAIETDAHMTRDGRIVLSHDPNLLRTAGVDRNIADCTLEELRRLDVGARFEPRPGVERPRGTFRMPTLEEALDAFPAIPFNIDAKQTAPDMIPAFLRAIAAVRAEDRVRVASFSTRNLVRARALGYTGETGLGASEIAKIVFCPRPAQRFLRVAGHGVQIPRRAYGITLASQRVIDRFHQLGLRVDFWTIDDPAEARSLFAMGADGVMTDDPRTLCGGLAKTLVS